MQRARLNSLYRSPRCAAHRRKVWAFSKADWDGLQEDTGSSDWSFLNEADTSGGYDVAGVVDRCAVYPAKKSSYQEEIAPLAQ